jgi:hypothetical protein
MKGVHAKVVNLRAAGFSYRRIAAATGYHPSTCWAIVRQHLAEFSPSREDAERIRALLFAEHEAVKEQLIPFVLPDEDDDGKPVCPDLQAVAAHLARGKEQAELYHLHGKQDEITHHEGENAMATAKAERTQLLMELLHESGLDGQPVLDVTPNDHDPVCQVAASDGHDDDR